MLAFAKGKDPAAEKKAERGAGTFADLHRRYLEEHAKKRNKSWRQAEALVNRHLLPRWGKLQASTIHRSDVKQMMARIEAPIVANQTLAAAGAIFTWAAKEELVTDIPAGAWTETRPKVVSGFSPTARFRYSGRRSMTPVLSSAAP